MLFYRKIVRLKKFNVKKESNKKVKRKSKGNVKGIASKVGGVLKRGLKN